MLAAAESLSDHAVYLVARRQLLTEQADGHLCDR